MTDPLSAAAREALDEVIENQIHDRTPPETKETFDRLVASGYPHDETMKMLGHVLLCELQDMVSRQEVFSNERFVAALNKLPVPQSGPPARPGV